MKLKKSHAAAVLALVVLVGAFALASRPGPTGPTGPDDANNKGLQVWLRAGTNLPANEPAAPKPGYVTGTESLPASLRGTEVAGELSEDAHGNLKITRGVRDVFDYFLSALGEESAPVLTERIRAYIRSRLQEKAATQAMALLAQYMAYKERVSAAIAGQNGQSLAAVEARRNAVRQLRRTSFDPSTYLAFFGSDEALENYGVERLALLEDKSLSPEAKAAKLAAVREQLPEALRDAMGAAEMVQTLDELTTQWRERGGTESQLRSVRERLVGAQAADRLETMDREDQAFERRINAYLSQRDTIRNDASLSESMRQQQLERLRAGFDEGERVRVSALETIHDAKGRSNTRQ